MSRKSRQAWAAKYPYKFNAPPPKGPNKKRCSCGRLDGDGDFWPARKKARLCYKQHPPSTWGGPIAKGEPHVDLVCTRCGRLEVERYAPTPKALKPPKRRRG